MIVIFAGIVTTDPQDPYAKPVVRIDYSTVDVVILLIYLCSTVSPNLKVNGGWKCTVVIQW